MAFADAARFAATSLVLSRTLGREAVLLDLGGGNYFGLDEVGTVLWDAWLEGATLGEACARVVAAYDVDPDTARRDAEALVQELLERGLIRETPP